jgi:hypothetical protein
MFHSPYAASLALTRATVAAALTIGVAGYAFAQNTITGAPAGTAPENPAPGTPVPIPGITPSPTGSHSSQMRHRANRSRERARPQPTTCATNLRRPRPKFPAAHESVDHAFFAGGALASLAVGCRTGSSMSGERLRWTSSTVARRCAEFCAAQPWLVLALSCRSVQRRRCRWTLASQTPRMG